MKVVSLADAREARTPHMAGKARCLDCRHEWVAVAPSETLWLTCPKCSLSRGRFINHVEIEGEAHWTCNCGNDLFFITKANFYCPNCGTVQRM